MTNSKSTKRALLLRALSLLMCVAMLVGTTFAWFTDTASTAVNKIQAGTLDVELVDKVGQSIEGETLDFVKAAGHENEAILWEPGCRYELKPFCVKNNGNLALKYVIRITGINGDAKLNEAIEWEFDGMVNGEGHLLAGETSAPITIKGHMKEEAGNEYMGLAIDGIAITVYATQDTVEYDSIDNEYDAGATSFWDGTTVTAPTKDSEDGKYHITSAAEFVAFVSGDFAIPAGNTVVLDCDVDLAGATVKGYCNGVFDSDFDGQGHTVSNFTVATTYSDGEHYCGLFPYIYGGHSVKNLTVKDAMAIAPTGVGMVGIITGAAYRNTVVENCHVINCTVVGEKKVGAVAGYTNGIVKDCSATDCAVFCKVSADEVSGGRDHQAGEVVGYTDGEGTVTDCDYENVTVKFGATVSAVSNAADLKTALDNASNSPSYDRNIILTADIDGSEWTAIPGGSNYPAVYFDGNGHTIKNLSACLFSSLPGRHYVFKNINFTDVDLDEASGNNAGLGVIVGEGMANGGGSYTITNCHINGGTIDGGSTKYVGGFIGFKSNGAEVKFVDCSVTDVTLNSAKESIGAFAGHLYDKVTFVNCAVKGSTSVTCSANRGSSAAKGGILVGTVYGADVKNCTIDSTVTLTNNAAAALNGGLFGRNPNGLTITVE